MTIHGRWMKDEFQQQLVSVIIPTYNRVSILFDSLESVLLQTYRPIEIIVIDDGSEDNTKYFYDSWMSKMKLDTGVNIKYLFQNNQGAPVARNLGLIESKGEYIQFLDSDDLLIPIKIEAQIATLLATEADFVCGDCKILDYSSGNEYAIWEFSKRNHNPADHIRTISLNTSSALYRRSALRKNGPWAETLQRWQDYEYNFRILANKNRGIWTADIFLLVRIHGNNISSSTANKQHTSFAGACLLIEQYAIKKNIYNKEVKNAIGAVFIRISNLLAEEDESRLANKYLIEGIRRVSLINRFLYFTTYYIGKIIGLRFGLKLQSLFNR